VKLKKGFTLLELIVVIIILGILATLGYTQYTRMVEKGRISEVVITFHSMRDCAIAHYIEYGTVATMSNADFGLGSDSTSIPTSCVSTNYFSYGWSTPPGDTSKRIALLADRCTSGGKTPQYNSTKYRVYCIIDASGTGPSEYYCEIPPGSGGWGANNVGWCTPTMH
jgi:prepilin-type N-terminal cleavage/methylation domain-containing protein